MRDAKGYFRTAFDTTKWEKPNSLMGSRFFADETY